MAIKLQTLDDTAMVLSKEVAALPKHIAEIEKKLDSHQKRLDLDRAALAANQRDRKKAEGDIQMQEQKVSKLKSQMLDAKTNEQYRAFQHEIEFCENEIKRFEEQILELMGRSEALDSAVKVAEKALAEEKKEVDGEKARARDLTAKDQAKLAALQADRAGVARQISRSLLSEYERIRKGRANVAVAEVINGRCSKCNMSVRLQFLQELRAGNAIMKCESCARILYINEPEDFSDIAPAQA